jgi:hypothetical protein
MLKLDKKKKKQRSMEYQTPKQHRGTVKRYLSEFQMHVLTLLGKQLL